MPSADAEILSSSKVVSDFFDECVKMLPEYKEVANWVMTEILKLDVSESVPMTADNLVKIIKMMLDKKITRQNAKELLGKVLETSEDAETLAKKLDMLSNVNDDDIVALIDKLIAENEKAVADYSKTPDKVTQFFIGQVMRATRGKADGAKVKEIVASKLG